MKIHFYCTILTTKTCFYCGKRIRIRGVGMGRVRVTFHSLFRKKVRVKRAKEWMGNPKPLCRL